MPRRLSGNRSKQPRNDPSRASSRRTHAPNRIPRSLRIPYLHPARRFASTVAIPTHHRCRNRDSLAFRTADAEHRDLTIVDLAQPPGPLPRNANRAIALLGEAALVDDQATGRLAAQQAVGVLADLSRHRLVLPGRVADKVLELLRAALVNHGRHRREGTVACLRQSAQIASCHGCAVARPGAEEPAVA